MKTVTFFETREELRDLTSLPADDHDSALWDAGFDLDDWDFGFVSDTEWGEDATPYQPPRPHHPQAPLDGAGGGEGKGDKSAVPGCKNSNKFRNIYWYFRWAVYMATPA